MSESVPIIDVQMSPRDRELIHQAADILGVRVDEWCRLILLKAAYDVVSVDVSAQMKRGKLN